MRRKRKTVGLVLIAALAMSSLLVANAGATRSGHFTSDSPSGVTAIVGHQSTGTDVTHKTEFYSESIGGISAPSICKHVSYHASIDVLTAQEIRVKPTWTGCETTPLDTEQVLTVHTNGCEFKFTSRTSPGDATAGLVCPVGKKLEITYVHNGCKLSVGTQTVSNAFTYETTVENGKHALTLKATVVGIHFTAHNSVCVFIPTTHTNGIMNGSVTVTGFDAATGNPVNITAT